MEPCPSPTDPGVRQAGIAETARTRDAAPIGDSHRAEAVVWHSRDLPGAAGPVVVPVLLVGVRHRVRVVGVQVIAAFWALETDPQSGPGALLSSIWEKQELREWSTG